MGLVGRHALNVMGNDWIFVLTFVDDLHIAAGGKDRWLSIWHFLVAMELVGTPFSYRNFRGDLLWTMLATGWTIADLKLAFLKGGPHGW